MTVAQIIVAFEGGGRTAPTFGSLLWTPTARTVDGTTVVLPTPFVAPLAASPQVIAVPLSDGVTWCWRVQEKVPGGTIRYVTVTADSAYSALLDVDPATLQPSAVPPAAWTVAVQNLQAGVDAVGAAVATVTGATASAAASAASAATSASLVGAPADTAMAVILGNAASASRVGLDARYGNVAPPTALNVTQRLYARTQPIAGTGTIRPLAKDPNQNGVNGTGRLWAIRTSDGTLGYTDDDGATFTVKSTVPDATGAQGLYFSPTSVWLLTASSAAPSSGNLWRMAVPDANGNPTGIGNGLANNLWGTTITAASNAAALPQATINVANTNYHNASGTITVMTSAGPQLVSYTAKTLGTFTGCTGGAGTMATGGKVTNLFRLMGLDNLALGPAGASTPGGVNSTFRNSSFCIDATETHAFICEYGAPDATYQVPALTDGIIAAGSALLYSASGVASAALNNGGVTITVAGAGAAGATLSAKIVAVVNQSGSACWRLSTPALTTVTAATITFPSTTYGAGVVVDGPTVYLCTNPTAAPGSVQWSKSVTFPGAKHAHAVKIIGGLPWVSLGDYGAQFPDSGMFVATSMAATVWAKRSNSPPGGAALDPINFIPVTVGGKAMVLGESDSGLFDGPLMFSDATGLKSKVIAGTCKLPAPYSQTMRGLSLLPTGNLMWFGTGETGAVGPTSCIWLSKSPYTVPVLLEDVGATMDTETVGDSLVSNGYVWFGTSRCVAEKFLGQ